MTIRKVITLNEEKYSGCGLCAEACHEGATGMVSGKAPAYDADVTAAARSAKEQPGEFHVIKNNKIWRD